MRYCRVIRDKSRRKLDLSYMNYSDLRSTLYRVGLEDNESLVRKYFKDSTKGTTAPGKMFIVMLQRDFSVEPTKDVWSQSTWPVRSGAEQTRILRRGKYDSVEDSSNRISQAAINDREPQQICWLIPQAFEVLSVYRMTDPTRSHVSIDLDRLEQKFASGLAAVMGDKLKEKENIYTNRWWTDGGREITVSHEDSSIPRRIATLKIGQKKFKDAKKHTPHVLIARLRTERGNFTTKASDHETIKDGIDYFSHLWSRAYQPDTGKRLSKASYQDEKKREQQAYLEAKHKADVAKVVNNWDKDVAFYNKTAQVMKLRPLPTDLTDEEKYEADRLMSMAARGIDRVVMRHIGHDSNVKMVPVLRRLLAVARKYPAEHAGFNMSWCNIFWQWLSKYGPKDTPNDY